MKLTTEERGGSLTIALTGELDHHQVRELSRELTERLETAMPRDCIVDMGDVTFMDSSGVALLLKAYKRMTALGGRLQVTNVAEQPMRVIDAAGIDRLFPVTQK